MNVTKQAGESFKPFRVPFDSLTLRAVAAELRAHLLGGQIQDVRQPAPTEILLGIRSHSRNYLLTMAADAQFARVHLTSLRRPNPPVPPNFCMTLRKHTADRWIRGIAQVGFDRILEIRVGGRDVEDEIGEVNLIAELMGKHSNLVLVNAQGVILDSAKRITKRVNRVRETLPGLVYQAPPEQPDRADPFGADAVEKIVRELPELPDCNVTSIAAALQQIFLGISPFLAHELATRALSNGVPNVEVGLRSAWKAIFAADYAGNQAVVITDDRSRLVGAYPIPLLHIEVGLQRPVPDLNTGLDECYTAIVGRARYEAIQGELRGKLDSEIKRLARQQAAAAKALQESGRAEEYKQMGELLLANLWQIRPGVAAVSVQDYYDPELHERTIPLNVKLSVQENVDSYFHRYRKARDAKEKEEARGAQAAAQLAACRAAQAELARLASVEAVQSLRDELIRKGLLTQGDVQRDNEGNHESEFQGHKIRRFPTPEGFEILVGESATANDFLTTRIAAPNDLWLHVRAAASSHVVIRTHGQPQAVPRSVLERAAILCAQHSVQKHSSLVSVDYTLKKYVRKPRGAAPGGADYQKEITIDVTPT